MADQPFEVHKQGRAKNITLLKYHKTIEVAVINNTDTVTISDLTTLDNVKMINLSDGADITVSILGNVITVNDITATAIRVLVVVVGT